MTTLRSFEAVRAHVATRPPARLAVAGGEDPEVMNAVAMALKAGLIRSATVTGRAERILRDLPAAHVATVHVIQAETVQDCATLAVAEIRKGAADILMKGHVDSTAYLRAIVDRASGIRGAGVLCNVTVAQMPGYPKLLAVTDNGILPAPDLAQKRAIVFNTRGLFAGLGIDPVRVAVIAATEKVSDRIPATRDAQVMVADAAADGFPGFLIDGPFGYDVAVCRAAAKTKGFLDSAVAGQADLILCPDINTANALAKSWKLHGAAQTGSIVLGARVPVLLNSRSDDAGRRLNALMLALAAHDGGQTPPPIFSQ